MEEQDLAHVDSHERSLVVGVGIDERPYCESLVVNGKVVDAGARLV